MEFWGSPLILTTLITGVLLAVGWYVERLSRFPAAITGGLLGLLGGPAVLAVLPLDIPLLEAGVYHALGLVFVCLGLKSTEPGTARDAPSMGLAISTMVTLQTVLGIALAVGMGLHTGFGLLLPLGFEQGPGQALALGKAWEASGLVDGGQLGLIIAAIGFVWSIAVGVPLALYGRHKGWVTTPPPRPTSVPGAEHGSSLTPTLAAVAMVYGGTWCICAGLAHLLAGMPDIAAMVWGFHFFFGAMLATLVRTVSTGLGIRMSDDRHLSLVSSSIVDVATVAALSAIQLTVFSTYWLPIVLLTTLGGLVTLVAILLISWRGFERAPFEHALLWFGMSTGTLPVGLALLRTVDPELRSPAPASAVYGTAFAVVGVAPVVLGLHPLAVAGSPVLALVLSIGWLTLLGLAWASLARSRTQRVDSGIPGS